MVSVAESIVYSWFDRSCIEYRDLFMRLYIAYNAWYRKTTGKDNDFEAIKVLKTRYVLWDEYIEGTSLIGLRKIMIQIVMMTRNTPMPNTSGYWDGVVKDSDDWRGLIHFWYEVRCKLFHGSRYASAYTEEVKLAYESLYVYMQEITARMKLTFHKKDYHRLHELHILVKSHHELQPAFIQERLHLHNKYITSAEIWNVDMMRRNKR
ncbi:MAG: hypothetical protein EOT05_03615 [Candidatus Microsaccharimonas sossegonensis]|uniref:Apea-like HEPN domain-containing protein n=1 Tax=Candidatus Microsaccharimonas sossegonensis TaxID=2506948 RepID=A0A4Q0AJF5_9BACT|nr:MAG: hypothetical protein EOT05_03615 [Candidatus Microsaccharimonas sossegonensis]